MEPYWDGKLRPFIGDTSIEFADYLKGAMIRDVGYHGDCGYFVIDFLKDGKAYRLFFGADEGRLFVNKVVEIGHPTEEDFFKQKILDFAYRDFKGEFDEDPVELVEKVMERRFSFEHNGKEVLSLDTRDIKRFPRLIRDMFSREGKNETEIICQILIFGSTL